MRLADGRTMIVRQIEDPAALRIVALQVDVAMSARNTVSDATAALTIAKAIAPWVELDPIALTTYLLAHADDAPRILFAVLGLSLKDNAPWTIASSG